MSRDDEMMMFLVLLNGLFSVLRRPKTNLRSTMGRDRLSHLALLSIEGAYVNRVDIEKVIDEFFFWGGGAKIFPLTNVAFTLLSSSLFLRSILRSMIFHNLKNISLVDQIFK